MSDNANAHALTPIRAHQCTHLSKMVAERGPLQHFSERIQKQITDVLVPLIVEEIVALLCAISQKVMQQRTAGGIVDCRCVSGSFRMVGVVREAANATLDVLLESRIDDSWNDDGGWKFSGPRTGCI